MPIVKSAYSAKSLLKNGHIQTIYPSLFRTVNFKYDFRERLETNDKDFIDIDWKKANSKHLVIISHGLEGNSERQYVTGLANYMHSNGYDILAWNYRTCSGEMNRLARMYHSGDYGDLTHLIEHVASAYDKISLIGFSLGGNVTLMYLANLDQRLASKIDKNVVISVPCDLADSSFELAKFKNKIYMNRFLRHFKKKLTIKSKVYPDSISMVNYHKIKNFRDFDNRYTSKLHGFRDAEHYWRECSSIFYLHKIHKPTLILSALDDPFLGVTCYPFKEAKKIHFYT
jgi:uncharacterized protein